MRPTRLGTAALLCSAALLTGCTSAVAGTSDETADALTEVLGEVDLEEVDP